MAKSELFIRVCEVNYSSSHRRLGDLFSFELNAYRRKLSGVRSTALCELTANVLICHQRNKRKNKTKN